MVNWFEISTYSSGFGSEFVGTLILHCACSWQSWADLRLCGKNVKTFYIIIVFCIKVTLEVATKALNYYMNRRYSILHHKGYKKSLLSRQFDTNGNTDPKRGPAPALAPTVESLLNFKHFTSWYYVSESDSDSVPNFRIIA